MVEIVQAVKTLKHSILHRKHLEKKVYNKMRKTVISIQKNKMI